jgi:hypothetical protein
MDASNYTQLFASQQGELVLKDLQQLWKAQPNGLDVAALAHLEGQRHVIRYIESQINKGSKES